MKKDFVADPPGPNHRYIIGVDLAVEGDESRLVETCVVYDRDERRFVHRACGPAEASPVEFLRRLYRAAVARE